MHQKIILLIIFHISSIIAQEKYCVILDFISDGSVSKNSCTLLSHTMNKEFISDGRYKLFDRKILHELLEQFSLFELSQECYDLHCLTLIGNLIGANIIIGGKVFNKDKKINIVVNMVDVKQKKKIQTITINTKLSKKKVITEEIPIVVGMLLESETAYQLNNCNLKQKRVIAISKRKRIFYKNFLLYSGAVFAGGASAILCNYFINKKREKSDDKPLSMDDLPQRTRHTE